MKPKKQSKKKTMTLISNPISSLELENQIQLKNINKDIIAIVDKYAKNQKNFSAYSDNVDTKEGFFLLWVKKDTTLPEEEQIQITTLAQSINMDEVINSMSKIIGEMLEEQKAQSNFS